MFLLQTGRPITAVDQYYRCPAADPSASIAANRLLYAARDAPAENGIGIVYLPAPQGLPVPIQRSLPNYNRSNTPNQHQKPTFTYSLFFWFSSSSSSSSAALKQGSALQRPIPLQQRKVGQ